MTPIKVTQEQSSSFGPVVTATQLFSRERSKELKKQWIEAHQLFVNDGYVYTPVMIYGCLFHMQCITGTLYGNSGRARDSIKYIDLRKMEKNDKLAESILMMSQTESESKTSAGKNFVINGNS